MAKGRRRSGKTVSESEIIELVTRRFATDDPQVILGVGDDAAVLRSGAAAAGAPPPPGADLVVTTDLLIEGVHFAARCLSLSDTGYKALAVNVSDIAAMGARPRYAFATLAVPRGATLPEVEELLDGVEQAAEDTGVQVLGGDTVASPQWALGFTVLGELRGVPLTRSGARPGDTIWHSGRLGLSQVGLHLLWADEGLGKEGQAAAYQAKLRHRRPQPQVALGRFLQEERLASACIDTSDSLAQCLLQLAEASGVGLELDFFSYSHAEAVQQLARSRRRWRAGGRAAFSLPGRYDPGGKAARFHSLAEFVLAGAEDYELLFTATPAATSRSLSASPAPLTCLGSVVAPAEGFHYRAEDGKHYELTRIGFEHL